jgi:two-component sensor histidine kinase
MRMELTADVDAPAVARRRIEEERPTLGACFEDVALILSELVSNSVRHATADDPTIAVRVDAESPMIRLEVSDGGAGFDTSELQRRDGLGLLIVSRLATDWGVDVETGTTVWVSIERSRCGDQGVGS